MFLIQQLYVVLNESFGTPIVSELLLHAVSLKDSSNLWNMTLNLGSA